MSQRASRGGTIIDTAGSGQRATRWGAIYTGTGAVVPIIVSVEPGETTAVVTHSGGATLWRVDGGASSALGVSPATITGLTAGEDYNAPGLEISIDGVVWSTPVAFGTDNPATGGGGVPGNATAPSALITAAAALIAGSASGAIGATAGGVTLSAAAALLAGAATGQRNASAAGAILAAAAALVPGSASGASAGTAAGATITAAASILAGAAAGQGNASAAGAVLSAAASIIVGAASGSSGATAAGVTLSAAAALLAGAAAGGGSAGAAGVTLTAAAQLIAGAATGGGAAAAPGALLVASLGIIAGSASGAIATVFRPTADVSAPGWVPEPTGGPLYARIDEQVPDDADFIHTAIAGASPAAFEIGPLAAGTYTLRVRGDVTEGTGTITVRLRDAGGVQLAIGSAALTTTPTTHEITLTFAVGTATQVDIEVSAP